MMLVEAGDAAVTAHAADLLKGFVFSAAALD